MPETVIEKYRLTKLLHEGRLDRWMPIIGYLYLVELDPGDPLSFIETRVSL